MELKLDRTNGKIASPSCFNRTFMELKFMMNDGCINTYECFNRTFMELKSAHWP